MQLAANCVLTCIQCTTQKRFLAATKKFQYEVKCRIPFYSDILHLITVNTWMKISTAWNHKMFIPHEILNLSNYHYTFPWNYCLVPSLNETGLARLFTYHYLDVMSNWTWRLTTHCFCLSYNLEILDLLVKDSNNYNFSGSVHLFGPFHIHTFP